MLVGALAYVGLGDPHRPDFLFPPCPFKALTGWNCPGCGGLRMTHDLLHGDLAAAVVDNVFVLVGLPAADGVAAGAVAPRATADAHARDRRHHVAAVTWTVVRNLPGFPLVPTFLDG